MNAKTKKAVSVTLIVVAAMIVAAALAAGIYYAVKHDRFSGYVYESDTGKPLEGVAVTNGRDVVKTDENGYYSLDGWLKDRFVTVTIPSGYWTEDFYIDVGKERDGYDFYLDKLDEDLTDHSFLQVSDTEVGASGVGDWIEDIKAKVESEQPAFLIHTGDICYEEGLKSHIGGMNSENMGVPVRYVIGNHDFVNWGGYGEALYESIYGPVNYSFDVGDVHYVVASLAKGDALARYTKSEVWRWMANDLAAVDEGKKVVVFCHDVCLDEDGFVVKYGFNTLDLKEHGLVAWVFGHWHYNYMNETEDGIFNISTARPDCGGIDSSPAAVRKVTFSDGELTSSDLLYFSYEKGEPADAVWTVQAGSHAEFAEPVLSDGKVYVGTADDGYPKDCGITCLDAESGETIWKYATVNSVKNSFYVGDGAVVVQDSEGIVYRLDAATGSLVWKTDTGLTAVRDTIMGIAVCDGRVFCGGGQKISCLSLNGGSVLWTAKNENGFSAPSRIVADGKYVYVGSHWDKLVAYDAATGKKAWSNDKDGLRYRTTTPTSDGEMLWVAAGSSVFGIDKNSGKALNKFNLEGYNLDAASAPYIENGVGYFTTADKGVIALSLADGKMLWNYMTGDALAFTSPYTSKGSKTVESGIIPYKDFLLFAASDGCVYLLGKDGGLVASYYIGAPVLSRLAVYGDVVYALDFSGRLTAFRI